MNNFKNYLLEYGLVLVVLVVSITGFWNIYFGQDAAPTPYQNLHVITVFAWLFLLLYQISLIGGGNHLIHKKIGLSILFIGPFLVATTALLSVYSAHKGLVSGEGDFLIVQNVMGTIELGFTILMAFVVKKRRKLHASFLLGSAVLFMGIALFFTLISFVPQFKIEGPETFYRFETAATTSRNVIWVVGILFFLKDRREGWPVLLVSSFFTLNNYINLFLIQRNLIQPVTEFVGSINQVLVFMGSFMLMFSLLILTGIANKRKGAKPTSA
ncbi:hypothetical protein D0X99_19290 [Algoriphagus lacus]|uniref:Uncharacterized protein n=1 Tax=Algoriphagus lacus TaxID=2056311 RepID=A0A418PLZ5_9BACT|nr:hypothetical protein [Algoriphagus lacus]RIW12414.1 hypothetical protein D0X99_19290 [Algoriphagus lacus]